MAKKELTGADKVQAAKAHEIFAGISWPGDASAIIEPFTSTVKKAAKKFLDWRAKEEATKLPSIRSCHFPHYTAFAACMVVSSEESLQTWTRRFLAGKAVRTAEEERARKLEKAKKLMAQLKELGEEFGGVDINKLLGGKQDDEDEDEKPAAHEGVEDEHDETPEVPVPAVPAPAVVEVAPVPSAVETPPAPTVAPAAVEAPRTEIFPVLAEAPALPPPPVVVPTVEELLNTEDF